MSPLLIAIIALVAVVLVLFGLVLILKRSSFLMHITGSFLTLNVLGVILCLCFIKLSVKTRRILLTGIALLILPALVFTLTFLHLSDDSQKDQLILQQSSENEDLSARLEEAMAEIDKMTQQVADIKSKSDSKDEVLKAAISNENQIKAEMAILNSSKEQDMAKIDLYRVRDYVNVCILDGMGNIFKVLSENQDHTIGIGEFLYEFEQSGTIVSRQCKLSLRKNMYNEMAFLRKMDMDPFNTDYRQYKDTIFKKPLWLTNKQGTSDKKITSHELFDGRSLGSYLLDSKDGNVIEIEIASSAGVPEVSVKGKGSNGNHCTFKGHCKVSGAELNCEDHMGTPLTLEINKIGGLRIKQQESLETICGVGVSINGDYARIEEASADAADDVMELKAQ
ncbi:MAG TPA: hypothetical protein DCR21_02100 [Succinivibrionaceae bacterium]|nr:hypothetical protein [Succinivibrionaceae bacterium]